MEMHKTKNYTRIYTGDCLSAPIDVVDRGDQCECWIMEIPNLRIQGRNNAERIKQSIDSAFEEFFSRLEVAARKN